MDVLLAKTNKNVDRSLKQPSTGAADDGSVVKNVYKPKQLWWLNQ